MRTCTRLLYGLLLLLVEHCQQVQSTRSSCSVLSDSCLPLELFKCREVPKFALVDGKCCLVCGEEVDETCTMDGQVYQSGERWTPSRVPEKYLREMSNPACMECQCIRQVIGCASRELLCPVLKCRNSSVIPGECCPACYDEIDNNTLSEIGSGLPVLPFNFSESCIDETNGIRKHGECWNLVYEGKKTCLEVCCNDSRVKLAPSKCSPVPPCGAGEFPYAHPLDCCPVCSRAIAPPSSSEVIPFSDCVGNLPYKVYLYKSRYRQRDSWAFTEVNTRSVTLITWKHGPDYTYNAQRTITHENFVSRKDASNFYYRGRTTADKMLSLSTNATIIEALNKCRSWCSLLAISYLQPTRRTPSCS
jgi:hypothetical protein